jgi:hypothetical protein
VVTSVAPYYTQKDLVFEPAMVGSWVNVHNPDEYWRFAESGEPAYTLTLSEPGKTTVMSAHAFKLQGQLFLDIFSLEQDYHVIPAHYLLKVTQLGPTLRFSELSEAWLKELLAKEPAAIRHHFIVTNEKSGDSRVVLTASTTELQDFVMRHRNTVPAWRESVELNRNATIIKTAGEKGQI